MYKKIISITLSVALLMTSIDLTVLAKENISVQENVVLEEVVSEGQEIDALNYAVKAPVATLSVSENIVAETHATTATTEEITAEVIDNQTTDGNDMKGSGTDEDPYIIRNVSQLKMMNDNLSASYKLANDLYLGTSEWVPIGNGEVQFAGHFDGDYHVIYGVNGFSNESAYRGLFGMTSTKSIIENVGLEMDEGVEFIVDPNDKTVDVGMLVGSSGGLIRNCYAKGIIRGHYEGVNRAGLLCGWAIGNIENCYTQGSVSATGEAGWIRCGYAGAGGVVGKGRCTITNCYSICTVHVSGRGYATSYNTSGGIIGGSDSEAKISNCYAICDAQDSWRAYGIADAESANCYYSLTHKDEITSNVVAESDWKLASTYKGWDFENTWVMGNDGLPKLQCFQKNKDTELSLVAATPSDGEALVSVDTDMTLYFSKNIGSVNQDQIRIYDEGNKELSYSVEFTGKKVEFQFENGLKYGTTYHVELGVGAVSAFDGANNTDTNNSEIKISFTTYEPKKEMEAGKYITFSEKNGVLIPTDDLSEYAKELKYWAAEYEIDDVANYEDIESILKKTVALPVKGQNEEEFYLVHYDNVTLMDLMRNELFAEHYQKNLNETFQELQSAEDYGDVVNAYKKVENYSEEAMDYFDQRESEASGDVWMTFTISLAYQAFLLYCGTTDEIEEQYKLSRPILDVSVLKPYVDYSMEEAMETEDYEEYKEHMKNMGLVVKGGKALYKAKVYGANDATSAWIEFGVDMFDYFSEYSDNQWIQYVKNGLEVIEKAKDIADAIKFAVFVNTSIAFVYMIPELVGKLWNNFNESTRAWYYLSDYYIRENYPNLAELSLDETYLYPSDVVFEMGMNDFPAYVTLYGTPEQIREIEEIDNDRILEMWCQFISKNIRAEKHLRGDNLSYRRTINSFGNINSKIEKIETDELKMSIVKYASSLIHQTDTTTVMVACPVTIKVFDKNTCELVASVSSEGKNYNDDSPYLSLYTLGEDNDIKCVMMSSDQYYVEIEPYDEGVMNISVEFGNGEALSYENVPLSNSESYLIENTSQEYFELMAHDQTVIQPTEVIFGQSISICTDTSMCNVGETVKYEVIMYPKYAQDSVEWSVDNPEVGTIDSDGTFHALNSGKAIITARLKSNDEIVDSKEITVISLVKEKIELNTTIHLEVDTKKELEIVGLSDLEIQTLSWHSNLPTVARITSDGYVLGIAVGETQIVAEYGDIVITVTVIVEEPKFVVQFDYGYDDKIEVISDVTNKQTINLPAEPARIGYIFGGWYTQKDGKGSEFTSKTPVIANITLYAYWIRRDYGDVLWEDVPSDGVIPKGIWVAGITDMEYTGENRKQSFRVYDNMVLLKEKVDYTVTYKNIKNAYIYTDEDYALFEKTWKENGKRTTTESFNPKKAPQVILKMKGNYSGSQTIYFKIKQADITEDDFKVDNLTVTYTGKKQTPAPKLTWNGKALKYGTDFYVSEYDATKKDKIAFKEAGTYALTVVGKKNFSGERSIKLTISENAKQISMNKVTVKGLKNLSWTGAQLTQTEYTVKYKKDILAVESGDYTVQWGTNTDVGIGTVTFTGTGKDTDGDGLSYIGTKKVSFKITGTAMSKVSVSGVEKSYAYTGNAIMPVAVLTYKASKDAEAVTLIENTHYTVTYQKNQNKGTATIIFTGLESGGYTGTKKVTFKIVAAEFGDITDGETATEHVQVAFKDIANIQNGVYVAPYMKGGAKPEVIVTSGDKTLEQGRDYTVSYSNNKKVALSTDVKAPTVTIKGKGNYRGKKSVSFTIAAKALSNENGITVVAKDKVVSIKKNGYKQNFKVYDADGKVLGSKDYDSKNVTYTLIQTTSEDGSIRIINEVLDKNSVVSAGSVIKITVQGTGIYGGGEATGVYRILESGHDISKATIQIKGQTYTGSPILITEQSQFKDGKVYIKIGKERKELILGEDIEVVQDSYVENINNGTAKVTFRGINDFGGTKTVTFKIGTRSIFEFWQGIYEKIGAFWN